MTRTEVVAALAADPLYQLSTAGQELFHTNLLYWLAAHRPEESRPVWETLGVSAPVRGHDSVPVVRREWRHLDLYVDAGMRGSKLVLENKVLAIATAKQLSDYLADLKSLKDFDTSGATEYRLLSLLAPTFAPPEPWVHVDYAQLVEPVRLTAANLTGSDRVLVDGYADLVRKLLDLREAFDPHLHPEETTALAPEQRRELDDARLTGLVRKMQMARCAEQISFGVRELGGIPAGAGFTRGEGLLEWFAPAPGGRQFGWQVQGSQFRLVGITGKRDPKRRADREALMQQHHARWFDTTPDGPLAARLAAYTGSKDWLGYEPNFVYRYRTLEPGTTWRDLIELGTWACHAAHDYAGSQR